MQEVDDNEGRKIVRLYQVFDDNSSAEELEDVKQ